MFEKSSPHGQKHTREAKSDFIKNETEKLCLVSPYLDKAEQYDELTSNLADF